ncbi:hypothetical protein [Enterococcus innesii]|uniref:hypothetical protein n=1 Tax=Enterococcus innesii TaxID=2839759 RepID=UPI0022B98C2F|nr:hypothetical protein [Enterococcus innesii]
MAACSSETKDGDEAEVPKVKKITIGGKEGMEQVLDDGTVIQTFDEEVSQQNEE